MHGKGNDDDLAAVSGGGRYRRVEVNRVVRAPIQRVWRAITDPDEVRRWWATGDIEAREGGRVHLEGDGDCGPDAIPLDGRIKVCLAPHVFEFTWNEAYDPAEGLVRFDLVEVDDATTLVTVVNLVPVRDVVEAAVGWHVLMDRLRECASGAAAAVPDAGRLQALRAWYEGSTAAAVT
jgi:uncharacterized protein YndB with AHSA1/START domain